MKFQKVRRAFTLIELLVVVTIIAILIALMVPALKSAKDMGNSAVCLSNLKQMGGLMNGYESLYNGTIVGTKWYAYAGSWTSWDNYLQALSVNAVPIIQNVTPFSSTDPRFNEKLFHCPAATLTIGANALQYADYACNDSVCTNIPPTGGGIGNIWAANFMRISQIKRPADIIAVGDCNQDYYNNTSWVYWDDEPGCITTLAPNTLIIPNWSYTMGSSGFLTLSNTEPLPVGAPDTGIRYRHGERTPNSSGWANMLFVDSHAESKLTNTVYARNLCVSY